MTFLETIFARLERSADATVLCEIRDGRAVAVRGGYLRTLIEQARAFVRARGVKPGDRCALIAPNSVRWTALDLALMAERAIAVPLYARQAPAELVGMMKDSTPSLICCEDAALAADLKYLWTKKRPDGPLIALFDEIFGGDQAELAGADRRAPVSHADSDAVTIIYTSGTSGEPKGVVLNAGNVNYMLGATNARLDLLMGGQQEQEREPERIFHYLPVCFAGSWILLLTALSRNGVLSMSTDLTKLADELSVAAPHYFLNVPALLERFRARIEENVQKAGGWIAGVYERAKRAYLGEGGTLDRLCLAFAKTAIFPNIRKRIGPNLKALICGSAPLARETQLFFEMIRIPVLQVYGLTETTAICTMDDPRHGEAGSVGRAIPGIEMKVAENGEILVQGPNIFPGYWQRPEATAEAIGGGWFHTGDQGEVNASGNWRITGRLKNLIILNSGHNVAPEPLEEALAKRLPEAQQVVLVGNQRGFLSALITIPADKGPSANASSVNGDGARAQAAVDAINVGKPHYKQIRQFRVLGEAFSVENGLLTANGKLKRDAIAARFAAEIETMYEKKPE